MHLQEERKLKTENRKPGRLRISRQPRTLVRGSMREQKTENRKQETETKSTNGKQGRLRISRQPRTLVRGSLRELKTEGLLQSATCDLQPDQGFSLPYILGKGIVSLT